LKTGVLSNSQGFFLACVFVKLKKISHLICLAQFRLGKIIFPIFELIHHFIENKDPEVRRHFNQAITNTKEKKQAIALLNLNMVLSLNPRHFLARVFRGRIYLKEGQYRLASEDYLEANKISNYRFIHYDLYREYFRSVNRKFEGAGAAIIKDFDQIFETLLLQQDSVSIDSSAEMVQEVQERLSIMEAGLKEGGEISFRELVLSPDETKKFMVMGPITQEELEDTDWDQLFDDLTC
jgi:tetratricopeptide (TPR) repeat protein